MLPKRGIEPRLTGDDESTARAELGRRRQWGTGKELGFGQRGGSRRMRRGRAGGRMGAADKDVRETRIASGGGDVRHAVIRATHAEAEERRTVRASHQTVRSSKFGVVTTLPLLEKSRPKISLIRI